MADGDGEGPTPAAEWKKGPGISVERLRALAADPESLTRSVVADFAAMQEAQRASTEMLARDFAFKAEREARRDRAADAAVETAEALDRLLELADLQEQRSNAAAAALEKLALLAETERSERLAAEIAATGRFRWNVGVAVAALVAAVVAAAAAIVAL